MRQYVKIEEAIALYESNNSMGFHLAVSDTVPFLIGQFCSLILVASLVALLLNTSPSYAEDDVNRLYNLSDASGMFNERGYAMSNSYSLSGNEVINDFNGNLMYSQRLLYLPISESGLHYDLKLVYNGNVSHTAFGARIGSNDIEQTPVNLPEWIISINGIAVQTFNFENELVTWKNDTSFTANVSYSDEVAAHIEGYHKCYRVRTAANGITNGVISILMEDGSVKEYYSTDTLTGPVQMRGGNYNSCSKDDPDRGYLWALGDQLYGYFTLFRADGTQVLFQVFQPTFRTNLDCVQSFGKTKTNYPRMLLPVKFKDAMGHEFDLSYSYTIGAETVLGRPVLNEIGAIHLEWDTWTPGNYGGVQVQHGGDALYDVYYADAVLTPSTGGRGVSWHPNYKANRGLVWRIGDPQQRVTKFSYRTYSRNYANMNFNSTFRVYGVCNDDNKEAGATYKLSPWRLWKIEYPEGGLSYFSYFDDIATAWASGYIPIPKDTITISYDHSPAGDCLLGSVQAFPCKKSARFDELGRDPFFLNIVSAARHTHGDNTIVSTDSLFFSWNGGVDEDYSITIEDEFTTRRWFGRDSLDVQIRTVYPDVKERLLEYRYFPENGLFSRNSRDRGWVLKLIYSRDSDLNWPTYDRLSKTYYWDATCVNNVCSGTFKLDSLVTQMGSEQYSERFGYSWLGDPVEPTVNNLLRKDATDPWGLRSETYYNSNYLSLSNPTTAYYNNSLIDSSKVVKVSSGVTLGQSASQYYGLSASEGHVGQVSRAVRYLLNSSGSKTDSLIDTYSYVKGGSGDVKFQGATKLHINPKGDTTFFYFPSSTESVTRHFLAHDGSVSSLSSGESFVGTGPSWFKMERHSGSSILKWHRKIDERGRLVWVVDPNGYRSEVTYDNLNRARTITLPGGYVPSGSPGDTAWSIWNYYDDDFANDPVSVRQQIRIDKNLPSRENRVWIDGLSRAYRHDQRNFDGSYDSTVVGLDFAGRSVSATDQLGYVTGTVYDYLDRAVKTTYPDPSHSSDSVKYTVTNAAAVGLTNKFSFPETIIYKHEFRDENAHIVNEYYDVRNKLRLRQTYDGQTPLSTYFDYDDLGNLTLIVKPMGDSVRYTYNSLGQLISEQNSDYYFWPFLKWYSYDKNGNLTSMRDPNLMEFSLNYPWIFGLFQQNSYDGLNRLVARSRPTPVNVWPVGWVPYYTVYERHFYDQSNCELSKGRLSLSYNLDPNGRTNYAERYDYDARGRIKKQVNYFHAVLDSTNISGTLWEYSVHGDSAILTYSYDWADQLKSVTYPDGSVVKYNYDRRGHLTAVGGSTASDSTKYAQLDYTQRDALQSMKLGGGLQQMDYAYNERGWLETINGGASSSGGAPNDLFGQNIYYYSHPSQPAGWNPQYNGNLFGQKLSVLGLDTTYTYRYDESDRLRESKLASNPFESFVYDGNGNVTTSTKRIKSNPVTDIVKNCTYETGTNRLALADRDHYLIDDTLYYDWNGNVIRHSGKKVSVHYDIDNRMIYSEIVGSHGTDKVWYHYNSSGQRIYKEHFFHYLGSCDETKKRRTGGPGPGGGTDTMSTLCVREATTYTYYILGQGQVYSEQSTPAPQSPKAKYIYAGGSRIAMRDSGNKLHYYLNDHLGSARVVIDSTGIVKDKYWYYSFGAPRSEAVSLNQSYRYTGKPFDNETNIGIYYYGARYYDPELGRFWARDPLASKYPSLSPYAYCLNNPLSHVDPNGMEVFIKGGDGKKAAAALDQATSLKLTYDSATGKVTATGTAKTAADQKLLEAINSTNVTVNLTTTRDTKVTSIDGSAQGVVVGLFDGSKQDSQGHVTTSQFINLSQAKAWEQVGGGTVGQSVLHETNESYIGGVMFPGQPYSTSSYNAAHNAATAIDPKQGAVQSTPLGPDGKGNINMLLTGPNGSTVIKVKI